MTASETPPAVRVNRPAVVVLTTIAMVLGLVPYVFFMDVLWVLPIAIPAVLLISALAVRHLKTSTTEHPGIVEMLLGGQGAAGLAGAISLMCSAVWGATWGTVHAVAWVARLFSRQFDANPSSIAFWVTMPLMALAVLGISASLTQSLTRQLYPETAGLRSVFYSLAHFERRRARTYLLVLAAVVLVAVLARVFSPALSTTWWFSFFLAYGLVLAGVPLQRLGEPPRKGSQAWSAVEGVKELFEAAGYRVVTSPRTGRDDIDPLLTTTPDLFAEMPERGYAIAVKLRSRVDPDDGAGLDELLSASWAIGKWARETSERPVEVEPLLIVIGSEPAPIIRIYEDQEHLRVVWINDPERIWEIQRIRNREHRSEKASQLLANLGLATQESEPA